MYQLNELRYGAFGDGTEPEVRLGQSSWLWNRTGPAIGGRTYDHGVTVYGHSSLTVDLNRSCTAYDAVVGIDDLTKSLGAVRFSVSGRTGRCGSRAWCAGRRGGSGARAALRPEDDQARRHPGDPDRRAALADWAQSRISCRQPDGGRGSAGE
ncbi:NPCBM/NEW2 domain-containing protein [Streptomyces sp. M19]